MPHGQNPYAGFEQHLAMWGILLEQIRGLFGRHKERPDISTLGSHDGSDMFDTTFCEPLSPARVRDGMENDLNVLKQA